MSLELLQVVNIQTEKVDHIVQFQLSNPNQLATIAMLMKTLFVIYVAMQYKFSIFINVHVWFFTKENSHSVE